MKNIKTFENWTSDIKEYFLRDDGEFDYEKWYKTWKISNRSKLYSEKSGYVLFEYSPLEPDWDESPTFTEIEWHLTDDYSLSYDTSDSSLNNDSLEWDQDDQMAYYIMFELLENIDIQIKFLNSETAYFNEETAETVYDGKYLEQFKN